MNDPAHPLAALSSNVLYTTPFCLRTMSTLSGLSPYLSSSSFHAFDTAISPATGFFVFVIVTVPLTTPTSVL